MFQKTCFIVILGLTFLTACQGTLQSTTNTPAAPAASLAETLTSNERARNYLLHVPPSYRSDKPSPLVIDFHGYGSSPNDEEILTGMSVKADESGFIVAYPDGLDSAWQVGPGSGGEADLQFIRDLITSIEKKYNIDTKRVYATGISNGGGMVNWVGCNLADMVAAIAPDSGGYNFWQDCHPSRPVPVLAFHGLDDHIIPYSGDTPEAASPPIEVWASAWAERNGCSTSPSVTTPVDTVTVQTWSNCINNADVILYTLANHGHSWPGSATGVAYETTSQAVRATDLIWDFFKVHPMP